MRKFVMLLFVLSTLPIVVSASRVDTISIYDKKMDKHLKNVIILPDSYYTSSEAYPIVYLLHGAYGKFSDWIRLAPKIAHLADRYELIIICPEGHDSSWYFDSPIDSTMQYESYITTSVVNYVNSHYRIKKDKKYRAITGLSMGGHGAFYMGIRHPELWGSIGSMSGGLDIVPFDDRWSITKRLGAYAEYPERWRDNSVSDMAYLLKGRDVNLLIDCGYDDFFFDVNMAFHKKLESLKIPHSVMWRPGKHSWDYWRASVEHHLLFFYQVFNRED